jgi:eukaryotic-like serine/threonine-protein kinase
LQQQHDPAPFSGQDHSSIAHASFSRLRFTAFAYPDEWGFLGLSAQTPSFFRDYPQYFDPGRVHTGSPYGFTRPDNNVMIAYDATMAVLEGTRVALAGRKSSFTPNDLRQALTTITGPQAIQGVSGQIAFGPDGNPIDKAVVILSVTQGGFIQIESVQGRFLKGL